MGDMADGWLPPTAPGAKPPPRFDVPPEPVAPEPPKAPAPTFARPTPGAATGERNTTAVWAITLGITGLGLLLLSLGSLFLVTLPCSAAAWVLAGRARKRIESGATTEGEGQATAALWLGRIGVIAGVAAMVVFIALLASGFDFEQLRDELDERRERERGGGGEGVRTSVEHLRAAVGAWLGR
jgi:hypothetical protein